MLHCPPYLKQGDKIALISTARKVSMEEMEFGISVLRSWGLEVILGKTIGIESDQYAGDDEQRAADFQYFLDRSDIKGIIMARGGYGTVRILDKINFNTFVNNPKWIIGYSDYTYLFNYINQYYGIQTLHASMPINFKTNTDFALKSLQDALFGIHLQYEFEGEIINPLPTIEGEILGGNLSILYAMLGTTNGMNFDHKILFLEDVGEYYYHIDRMMMSFIQSNKLNNLKALVVGGFTEMNDNTVPFGKSSQEIIAEHCSKFGYPIIFNAPFGHIDNNGALKLGTNIKILINNNLVSLIQN